MVTIGEESSIHLYRGCAYFSGYSEGIALSVSSLYAEMSLYASCVAGLAVSRILVEVTE